MLLSISRKKNGKDAIAKKGPPWRSIYKQYEIGCNLRFKVTHLAFSRDTHNIRYQNSH